MKYLGFVFLVFTLIQFTACSKDDGQNDPNSDPNKGSNENQGVEQGNGMIQYKNETLDIEFEYPETWTLSEEKNKNYVKVSNKELTGNSPESTIEFERLLKLDGKKIKTIKELESILTKLIPNSEWKEIQMNGHRYGLYYLERNKIEDSTTAHYYFLDGNYNILKVIYVAFPNEGGEDIVFSIIGSMLIDLEGPRLFDVEFEPKEAMPGDTVTLKILVIDDASGVNANYFEPATIDFNNFRNSWIGYDVTHKSLNCNIGGTICDGKEEGVHYYPAFAYPHKNAWTQISKFRFEYKFKIPDHAPAGILVSANISLKDNRGNRAQYSLEPYAKYSGPPTNPVLTPHQYLKNYRHLPKSYRGPVLEEGKMTKIKAARLKILGQAQKPSERILADVYWEYTIKHSVPPTRFSGPSYSNKLIFELANNNTLIASKVTTCATLANSSECAIYNHSKTKLPMNTNHFYIGYSFCNDYYACNFSFTDPGTLNGAVVSLIGFILRDEYGNLDFLDGPKGSDRSSVKESFIKERFGRPIIFQMAQ